jgi:hypothetical protein
LDWRKRGFAAPSPANIKSACLIRNGIPGATWVETGTYLGETARMLAEHGNKVFTVEPQPELYIQARERLDDVAKITVIHGTSEAVLPELLPTLSGDVNFWLDGHYSAGVTFEGSQHTPILDELSAISANLSRFGSVAILVDDIRCFDPRIPGFSTYPPLDSIVDWAREHDLSWHIEHDILCMRRQRPAGTSSS